jgi:signal transduction histidine kinase
VDGTRIGVSTCVDNNFYEIAVINQGRGMTPEQISQVGAYMQFERRIHEQQGSGLGLIICKRLAELHDGDLSIQSTPGSETTVRVRLPVKLDGLNSDIGQ